MCVHTVAPLSLNPHGSDEVSNQWKTNAAPLRPTQDWSEPNFSQSKIEKRHEKETLVKELYHPKAKSSLSSNTLTKKAETFPTSSPPHHLPGRFPPSLSWVRWSNNSCLSCRWRVCTEKATLKGLFMVFLWSASAGEHNGLVLNCQTQSTLLGVACRHFQCIRSFNVVRKTHNSWLSSTFFSWNRVTILCYSSCFYTFHAAFHFPI